jgi:hypothetical protein
MRLRRVVGTRLTRLWRDLRAAVTLRRHEKRPATYALRLLALALLAALPIKKLVQLGPVDGGLALLKAAAVVALLTCSLAAWFAASELMRRRGVRNGREGAV